MFAVKISISTISKIRSNHYPLLLEFHIIHVRVASQFKFLKTWTLQKDCRKLIEYVWTQKIIGCHMFVLNKKLHLLKREIREWNKNIFGNVSDNVRSAEESLSKVQH